MVLIGYLALMFCHFPPPVIPPADQRCYGGLGLVGALVLSSSLHGAATPLAWLGSSGSSVVVICLPRTGLAFCVTVPSEEGRQTAARQGIPVNHPHGSSDIEPRAMTLAD